MLSSAASRRASKGPASALLSKSRQQARNITFGWWAVHHDNGPQREMHRRQQARNNTFGWWALHHDNGAQQEMHRRDKAARHKCSDTVSKKLLWEQQSGVTSDVPRPYRHSVNNYWQLKRSFAFTRHRCAKESSETKPESWTSGLGDLRTLIDKSQASFFSKTGLGMSATSTVSASPKEAKDRDYVIDPITNRKISKVSAKSAPDENVGVPPSQPSTTPTFDADFPPTKSELTAYGNVEVESGAEVSGTDSEKNYNDLYKYRPVSWNEPDGKPSDAPVELGHEGYDQEEVQKYKPYQWNEPDGKPKETEVELGYHGYDPAEVQKYQPFMWNEPDGQPTAPPIEVGHHGYDPAELAKYKPFMWNEPDGQPSTPVEQGHHGYDQAEVQQYQAIRHNEPDGKPAVPTGELGYSGYDQKEVQQYKAFHHNEPDGRPTAAGDSTAASLTAYDANTSNTSTDVYSKVLRKMENLTTMDKQTELNNDCAPKTPSHAERAQAFADPYSTEPQGLETAYARECGNESAGLPYVKVRRSTDRPNLFEATDPAAPQTVAEPYVYKILAYDPAEQSVNIVETTSTVSDAATPSTPAEVLLRMSSPVKFLPHIESLQAQGFEIVSGTGDVMVFRKERIPSADKAPIFTEAGASTVNPIDMTGKEYVPPATANFVSPTGYVNLDPPPMYENPPTSATEVPSPSLSPAQTAQATRRKAASERFQSNIGVRREEPVFSGPKQTTRGTAADKKPGIAKRMLVGATWVAGVSYGLGVAGEYLKGM